MSFQMTSSMLAELFMCSAGSARKNEKSRPGSQYHCEAGRITVLPYHAGEAGCDLVLPNHAYCFSMDVGQLS
jgi:hypothetical protein